jgi:carboxysome peptide B
MEINQVVGTLYCTERIEGLRHCSLRILKDKKGKLLVATDPVGTRPGNWVFTVSGSAGRYAMGNPDIMTDLTIGGIIDAWAPETVAKPEASSSASPATPRDKAA